MFDPDKGGFTGNSNAWCPGIDGADPPTGWWGYEYNSLGDLISQTDAKRQRQRLSYDALGRKISRTEHRVDGTVEAHTRWHYDGNTTGNTTPAELGNLTNVFQTNNRVGEAGVPANYGQIYANIQPGRTSATFTSNPDNPQTA